MFENVDGRLMDAGAIGLLYTHTGIFGSSGETQMPSVEKRKCPVGKSADAQCCAA